MAVQHCGISLPFTAGNYIQPGLPNITGDFNNPVGKNSASSATGAFANSSFEYDSWSGHGDTGAGYGATPKFNAALSNSIYGNSSTVQPPALNMRYFVKF